MKKILILVVCLFAVFAVAQDAAKDQPKTTASVLNGQLSYPESELVQLADAVPDDKYSFAPTQGEFKGARTVAEQLKHIGAVNYILGSAMSGEKPPVEVKDEKGPADMKTKADIAKYLKDSFAFLHKAYGGLNDKNSLEALANPFGGQQKMTRLDMATIGVGHVWDHYGQLAVYSRMLNIIPPASRPQPKQ